MKGGRWTRWKKRGGRWGRERGVGGECMDDSRNKRVITEEEEGADEGMGEASHDLCFRRDESLLDDAAAVLAV